MSEALSAEKTAEIIRKTVKLLLSDRPLSIADLGDQIYHVAKQLGEKPEDVATVFKPILQEVVNEALAEETLKATFANADEHYDSRHYHRRGFGGGHGH